MKFYLSTEGEVTIAENIFELEVFDEDSLTEIFIIIENLFYQSQKINFKFECLGEQWPVFILGDFSVFLEQLLDFYFFCSRADQTNFILDFYEQGIERKLNLSKINSRIKIENISKDKWISSCEEEYMGNTELTKEILSFVKNVQSYVDKIYPKINKMDILQVWYSKFL